MSNIQLKMGQSNPTHNYLLRYSYEAPDPYEEDGENLSYDGEVSTYILPEEFKNACEFADDSYEKMTDTHFFQETLDHALADADEDTSNWENIEFVSATPFDKRKGSWG